MRNKIESYNFLEGGRSFYYGDIFSGLSNERMSPALYFSPGSPPPYFANMEKILSSSASIPKHSLDNILYYLTLEEIKNTKPPTVIPQKRHPHFLFQYYKNFQVRKRLKDTALSLLKTQYTKFPVDHGVN